MHPLLERLKGYTPLCFIATGLALHRYTAPLAPLLPWIIATMLLCAVVTMPLSRLKPRPEHLVIYLIQMGLGAALYALLQLWDREVALSLVMCFLAPAATAAGAMTSLMGGDTGFATAYTLLTHGLICLVAPMLLPLLAPGTDVPFWTLSAQVAQLVAQMVLVPILLAQVIRYCLLRRGHEPKPLRRITYWLWLSSLIFILGKAVSFVSSGLEVRDLGRLVASFAVGFVACALQFSLGRLLAPRLGVDEVAFRQAMGQKNTALVLWLCIAFLPPLAAPGIAGYIAWQNFFLSYYLSHPKPARPSSPPASP